MNNWISGKKLPKKKIKEFSKWKGFWASEVVSVKLTVKPMAKSIATKVLLQYLVHAGKVYIENFTKYFIHEGQ